MSRSCLRAGLIIGFIAISASTVMGQTSGTWRRTTNNEKWTVDNNWTGQAYAQGVDQTADFGNVNLTADTTVDLDGNITIGNLVFGDTTPSNNWTLSGTGVLTLDVTAGSPTITVNNQTTTIAVGLSGSDGFTKAGAGTLLLTGANNYTGGTTISNGTLSVSSLANGGVSSNIGSSSSAASNLVLNGGTLLYTGTGSTSDRQFTLGTNGGTFNASGTGALVLTSTTGPTLTGTNTARTLTLTGNSAAAINNSMAAAIGNNGTGATSLTKSGSGTWVLSGNSTYSGLTTVDAGVLTIQSANALGSTVGGTSVTSGAALQIQGGITTAAEALTLNGTGISNGGSLRNVSGNNTYSGAITLGSASTIRSDSGTLTLDVASGNGISATNQNLTFRGAGNITVADTIFIGTGSITKLDGGTLTLSGANLYNGGTTWGNSTAGGVISLGSDSALGLGTLTVSNSGVVGNNWIQSSSGTARMITNNIVISGSDIQFNTGGTGNLEFAGTVNLGGGGRTFNVVNAETTFSGSISGTSGNSLTKGGAGTMILTGANTYDGTTTVLNGTLQLGNGGNRGSLSTSSSIVLTGGTFSVNQNDTVTQGADFSGAAITGAGGFTQAGTGRTVLTAANTYSGATTVSNGTLQLGDGGTGGSLSTSSAISVATGATFSVNQSDTVTQGTDFSGSAISGAGGFTQAGTGTTVLTAANTYTGATTVSNGTLQLGNGGTGGSLSTSSAISVASGATFSVNQSDTVTQGTDFSGSAISGQGGFTQAGSGTTILAAANSYTGATNVNAGTLRINGNQIAATGNVTVASGATLGGSGTIGGATTISGVHSPGNSPGLQTFTNGLTYLNGSSLTWELAANTTVGRGTNFDAVDVTGGILTINSGVTSNLVFNGAGSSVKWSDVFWATNQLWLVYDNANLPTVGSPIFTTINVSNDSDNLTLSSVRSGSAFYWSKVGSDIFLNYAVVAAAVPEPGAFGLMCIASLAGVIRYRRRRKEMPEV